VTRINVVVATTSPDFEAEGIARSVQARPDMSLVEGHCVATHEVDNVLESLSFATPCALVLVERASESDELAQRWLAKRHLGCMSLTVTDTSWLVTPRPRICRDHDAVKPKGP